MVVTVKLILADVVVTVVIVPVVTAVVVVVISVVAVVDVKVLVVVVGCVLVVVTVTVIVELIVSDVVSAGSVVVVADVPSVLATEVDGCNPSSTHVRSYFWKVSPVFKHLPLAFSEDASEV